MSLDTIITISIALVSVFSGLVLYIRKMDMQRIDKLESSIVQKADKEEVKDLISAKLDPMREDIKETKELLIKLLDLELKKKSN